MTEYYMPQPIEPSRDWIARVLTFSLWVSVAGLIIYGAFAYAFDDIAIIPEPVQSVLVVIGSLLIVTGAELNTPPTLVAVFRKVGRGKQHWLDLAIGSLSLIGAIASILILFALRQPGFDGSRWRNGMLAWGPLALGITVVVDYFGSAAELGLLRAEYAEAMDQWLEDKRKWEESHALVSASEPPVSGDERPVVGVADFRRLVSSLNGNRSALSKENLAAHFEGMRLPAESTVDRWFREEMN